VARIPEVLERRTRRRLDSTSVSKALAGGPKEHTHLYFQASQMASARVQGTSSKYVVCEGSSEVWDLRS